MFINDNLGLCATTYSIALVVTQDSTYASDLITKFTINADTNVLEFDQTGYTENVIHLLVTANTLANVPLTERVDVIPTSL